MIKKVYCKRWKIKKNSNNCNNNNNKDKDKYENNYTSLNKEKSSPYLNIDPSKKIMTQKLLIQKNTNL